VKHLATVSLLILSAALLCHARQPPRAEDKAEAPSKQADGARRLNEILEQEQRQQQQGGGELDKSLLPDASGVEGLDPQTKERYYAAMREYYDYRASGYRHRLLIFEWQFLSSKIIFFVVIFLVLTGVYFSGVQFHSSLRRKRAAEPAAASQVSEVVKTDRGGVTQVETAVTEITEIEASAKGIKVSSPVLGVIILIISFMFFYLYLLFVYPIVDSF
jgi:hypothetical protein